MVASSIPVPPAGEVVVVGRSRRLTALAESLHERYDFRVTQLFDEAQLMSRAAAKQPRVFIMTTAAYGAAQAQLAAGWRSWSLLVLATGEELRAPRAWFEQMRDARVDFVVVTHPEDDHVLDTTALAEVAVRVRRLEQWMVERDSGLHDPRSGRLHAGRIAEFVGVSLSTFAAALGRNYTTLHKTPDAAGVQEVLGPWARAIELLGKLEPSDQAAREWLNTPHRELDERTPLQVMLHGQADVVRDMLEAAYLGLPT